MTSENFARRSMTGDTWDQHLAVCDRRLYRLGKEVLKRSDMLKLFEDDISHRAGCDLLEQIYRSMYHQRRTYHK